ncbi:acetylxylan esterase [Phragmitibacter flavus]|uniref:Acetylxylan esterase n=2 Tax=Phragmitibacter flavus TaxID=2576071 RepID=A0A5R8KHV8_9BACT|nr:acetylxylan esterase [Phragmitibacter flavus]
MQTFRLLFPLALLFLHIPIPLPAQDLPAQDLKDLKGYFPFNPPTSLTAWEPRKTYVRRQILVSQGLWPLPTKTPLNPVIHSPIDCGTYTIEKVYFQSAPGLFVTGNLYRPKNPRGKVPGILFAHGHRKDARFDLEPELTVRKNIAIGAERFTRGGQSTFQSLCHQLASMGCVVWQWDMLSDSDAQQFSEEIVHKFAKQRPEMNTVENWGLYSPQAEAHLQNIMGIQTWNAIRSLDFLLTLPEVDPTRTAITGASGGGTQTMLLAAIDDRIQLSFPVVMVSTAMQGGCTCENASLLRINTGNVEFAALFAPKPQGMNSADDWTKEMATKGFPELQKLYQLYNAPKDHLLLQRGEIFPHAYNAVSRSAFYTFLNHHFKLGFESPIIETDFEPLTREQLTVWNAEHPAPKSNGTDFERTLLRWFDDDAQKQLQHPQALKQIIAPALEVMIGRTYAQAGEVTWGLEEKTEHPTHLEMQGSLTNTTHHETIPTTWLYPKQGSQRVILWLDNDGRNSLREANGKLKPTVQTLLDQGNIILSADLRLQPQTPQQTPIVDNPRQFAGYTHGYNPALFAQRTHDLLTLTTFLQNSKVGNHPNPNRIDVIALGETGPIAIAARALTGNAINHLAAQTNGFRFSQILDYRHPQFLPGAAKYLDLPGLIALNAPHPILLIGESDFKDVVAAPSLTQLPSDSPAETAIVHWLQKSDASAR